MNKRGKSLGKKVWCCVGGRVLKGNLQVSTEFVT